MSRPSEIIIIGAPRSGTNMLRDVLTALPGYSTWDCDEINLMWRHGNRDFPSDELCREHATASVKTYMRAAFDKVRSRTDCGTVVEKTCANSLRVKFVREVMPRARFILITRDGLDAAASALQRWNAPLDVRYTAAKARYVPVRDIPHYGVRFLRQQWRRQERSHRSGLGHAWWGPKPHDWAELAATQRLDEIAMIQWQRCVELARREVANLPTSQVHHVVYETFVKEPQTGLAEILSFLGDSSSYDERAVAGVTAASVGKGRASLSPEAERRLTAVAGETLQDLGYVT